MARRQDAAGRRRAPALRLVPGALVAFGGVGFWRRQADRWDGVDCGARAGLALAALRAGWTTVGFSGPARVAVKLAEIARQLGARIVRGRALR